ncbi:MAG: OmpA family protein [Mariniphaga sp.]|jgi:outer membrane protein OmpA-like peptidoglycan-associated protein|nr:OmpA family protein [Mariniphaga sp.]
MKTKLTLLFTAAFFLMNICAEAQKIEPKKKVEEKTTKRVDKKIDKGIDKGLDKLEEGLGGLFGKKKKMNKNENEQEIQATQIDDQVATKNAQVAEEEVTPELNWAKYDFVPGDKVIFEDNQENEENGEFPSRWDLIRGNVEIAVFGGENVIMLRDGAPSIIPYLKNSSEDYLPDVFTIEFDLYYPGGGWFETYLYDRKNQESGSPTGYTDIEIRYNQLSLGQISSTLPDKNVAKSRWMHIAIAYTHGKLKAYMDETRLLNIPRLDFDPKGLTLYTYHAKNDNLYYVKNVRIAEGGVKYYDRFLQDGKIIANGIRFDVNKATLRPESMGVINEIAALMKDHPEVKFSVEGHTDSDGDDNLNQTLSEQRAGTVVATLEKLGIDTNRLTSKGWGESKPMDTNSTPEGKANNRRVEFVKM